MEDLTLGKGAVREDIPDPRDYQWGKDIGMTTIPFDWEKGYDVEEEVSQKIGKSFKLKVKNQNGSSSCGGQAWAYYGEVLDTLSDKEQEEKSAKFIYSHTYVGTGGSGGRENCNFVIEKGWGNEIDCPSYENGLPPGEGFMIDRDSIPPIAFTNALKDRGLAYANVLNREIENIATAVRDNHGCIFGVTGTNNGTWRSKFPLAPTTYNNSWNHWMYVGKVKVINGKKYFGTINSWGSEVGEGGWQCLSEDYIRTFILGYPVIWSIWTMVIKADVVIPPPFQFTQTLRLGSRNGDVKMLQMKLGGLVTDGIFGLKTLKAVKVYQTSKGLVPDGIVGPLTRAKLNE